MPSFWILLEQGWWRWWVVTTEAMRLAELQLYRHHQQTDTQLCYRTDAFPVTALKTVVTSVSTTSRTSSSSSLPLSLSSSSLLGFRSGCLVPARHKTDTHAGTRFHAIQYVGKVTPFAAVSSRVLWNISSRQRTGVTPLTTSFSAAYSCKYPVKFHPDWRVLHVWNGLPASLRQLDVTVKHSARQLKAHFFRPDSRTAVQTGFCTCAGTNDFLIYSHYQ